MMFSTKTCMYMASYIHESVYEHIYNCEICAAWRRSISFARAACSLCELFAGNNLSIHDKMNRGTEKGPAETVKEERNIEWGEGERDTLVTPADIFPPCHLKSPKEDKAWIWRILLSLSLFQLNLFSASISLFYFHYHLPLLPTQHLVDSWFHFMQLFFFIIPASMTENAIFTFFHCDSVSFILFPSICALLCSAMLYITSYPPQVALSLSYYSCHRCPSHFQFRGWILLKN